MLEQGVESKTLTRFFNAFKDEAKQQLTEANPENWRGPKDDDVELGAIALAMGFKTSRDKTLADTVWRFKNAMILENTRMVLETLQEGNYENSLGKVEEMAEELKVLDIQKDDGDREKAKKLAEKIQEIVNGFGALVFESMGKHELIVDNTMERMRQEARKFPR